MAGLKRLRFARRALRIAAGALAFFVSLGCQQTLSLKALVEREVVNSKIGLALYDGSARILPGETVGWPNTIFGEPATKTLTLKNDGAANVTLSGPVIVSKTGGGGAAAYGGIVQPVQLTLPPGASTSFSVNFTPAAPDADYSCDFVINSNDASFPAYAFSGSGHSTQWHGSKAITPPGTFFSNPQIAIDSSTSPPTIYVSYLDAGTELIKSTNGGLTWSSPSAIETSAYYHSLAASNGNVHIFYMDTGTSPSTLKYKKLPSGWVSWQYIKSYSANTSYLGMINSSVILANSSVYLVFNDTTNSKLEIAQSMDTTPAGMSFTTYDVTGGATGQTGGFYPSLRFSGSTAYVSYLDSKNLNLAYGALSGLSYKTIYSDPSYLMGCNALALNSANGVLLYGYNGNALSRSSSSTLGGTNSWSAGSALNGENAQQSHNLSLLYAGSMVYSLYYEYSATSGIRFAKSTDNGVTWARQWLDTGVGASGAFSALAVSGNDIYALYSTPSSYVNGASIILKKSLDGGATW